MPKKLVLDRLIRVVELRNGEKIIIPDGELWVVSAWGLSATVDGASLRNGNNLKLAGGSVVRAKTDSTGQTAYATLIGLAFKLQEV